MLDHPSTDDVLAALGDKVVEAFAAAVAQTRDDLSSYRAQSPLWVAEHSERGLAGWIHDRLWANLVRLLHGVPDVYLYSSEPTREVIVNHVFRVRVKRHDSNGAIASYPTQGALEFFAQPSIAAFDGMEQIHLIAGYRWAKERRDIGEAVLSLRDGKDNVIWLVDLDNWAAGSVIWPVQSPAPTPIAPQVASPTPPGVKIVRVEDDEAEESP